MENTKTVENIQTEKCVSCGCDTGVLETVPIQDRKYYIYGCGQLCENCYHSLGQEGNIVE